MMLEKIGENLEYVNTYVNTRIEIEKIEFAQNSAKILTWIYMRFILGIILTLIFLGLIGLLTYFLSHLFNSFYIGTGIVIAFLVVLTLIIRWVGNSLMRKSIAQKIYELIENKKI